VFVVHWIAPPGACGRELRFSLPSGEQAQGAYSVSATETVVPPLPVSTLIVRPKPSWVVLVQRPFRVAVWVSGL
jgi:hypothetical protein